MEDPTLRVTLGFRCSPYRLTTGYATKVFEAMMQPMSKEPVTVNFRILMPMK